MWFWLSFASAVFGAFEIIANKHILKKVSSAVLSWSLLTLSIPFLIPLVIKDGIPNINQLFLAGVSGSALTYVFAKTMYNDALKQNTISKVLPLTSFSGVFTYIFGLIILSESIRPIPVMGLFSVIIGSYILNADQAKEDVLKPFKLLFTHKASTVFLFAIFLSSLTAVFDKLGLSNTTPTNPAFTILLEQIIMSILLTFYLMRAERKTWIIEVKNNFLFLLLCSAIYIAVSLFVFYAYTGGSVALTLGIKRLQIFFVLLLGYLFFNDKPTKHSWIATIIMAIGVIMIKLG